MVDPDRRRLIFPFGAVRGAMRRIAWFFSPVAPRRLFKRRA